MILIEPTSDNTLLVENYGLHWVEMGVGAVDTRGDWRNQAHQFLANARMNDELAAFRAQAESQTVGTACCHLVPRAFPAFRNADAARLGYLWGVYVVPEQRGRGIGGLLVSACMTHLKSIGCGRAILHAGERSAVLYGRMGFTSTEELAATL
jgi:GNAT superfamily N-acetyltransferase